MADRTFWILDAFGEPIATYPDFDGALRTSRMLNATPGMESRAPFHAELRAGWEGTYGDRRVMVLSRAHTNVYKFIKIDEPALERGDTMSIPFIEGSSINFTPDPEYIAP